MTNAELESLLASERKSGQRMRLLLMDAVPWVRMGGYSAYSARDLHARIIAALGAEPGDAALTEKEGQGAPAADTADEHRRG